MWFTVEEEKPDIGTVIFKADDYYERLQYITGIWNDNKFLFHEMYDRLQESPFQHEIPFDCDHVFSVSDITNVPMLLAYLERTGKEGGLSEQLLDFMWDMHKLYVKKMSEFGHAINWMSKKEYSLLDNHERWLRLVRGMEELQMANKNEEERGKRRKRRLKPVTFKHFSRIETIPNRLKKAKGKTDEVSKQSRSKDPKGKRNVKGSKKKGQGGGPATNAAAKELVKDKQTKKKIKRFRIKKQYEDIFAWDFGKTRLFDRTHGRQVGKHLEFTRFYHKLSKALRFSKYEPVDWRSITLEEIDKHRYHNDCWMALKGRVYDVTAFVPIHPGGAMINQAVGSDATDLFVAVHPHVVFYEHLKGKQIGTLPDFQEHHHTEWEQPAYFNIYRTIKEWFLRPRNRFSKFSPKTSFEQDEEFYIYSVFYESQVNFPKQLVSTEDDWTITIINGFQVTVLKFINPPYVWFGGFDLRTQVLDDSVYRWFSTDYNTLQLKIAKTYKVYVSRPIKDKRQDNGFFLSSYSLKNMFIASVVQRETIVEGVKLYGITVGMNKFIGCPIGCYVNLKILDEVRPYTPVCLPDEFEEKFKSDSGDFNTLFFIIKEFKDGDFTSMLHYIPLKKILEGVDLYVSPPMGNFQLKFLFSDVDMMLLIAGGTGISVMTRIIQHYVQERNRLNGLQVCLFFFVQSREDLIWQEVWEKLEDRYDWFYFFRSLTRVFRYSVEPVVTQAFSEAQVTKKEMEKVMKEHQVKNITTPLETNDGNPYEMFGQPSIKKIDMLFDTVPRAREVQKHKAIVCGPYGFNRNFERLLKEFGKHQEKNVHYFAA